MLVSAGGDQKKIEIMSLNYLRKVQVKNSKFENEFEGGLSKWTVINTFQIPEDISMCRRVILSSHGMLCTETHSQMKKNSNLFFNCDLFFVQIFHKLIKISKNILNMKMINLMMMEITYFLSFQIIMGQIL